jgi:hypothetical protein
MRRLRSALSRPSLGVSLLADLERRLTKVSSDRVHRGPHQDPVHLRPFVLRLLRQGRLERSTEDNRRGDRQGRAGRPRLALAREHGDRERCVIAGPGSLVRWSSRACSSRRRCRPSAGSRPKKTVQPVLVQVGTLTWLLTVSGELPAPALSESGVAEPPVLLFVNLNIGDGAAGGSVEPSSRRRQTTRAGSTYSRSASGSDDRRPAHSVCGWFWTAGSACARRRVVSRARATRLQARAVAAASAASAVRRLT